MNANTKTPVEVIEHNEPKEGEEWVTAEYAVGNGNGPCIHFEGEHHNIMVVSHWANLEPEDPADLPAFLRSLADYVERDGLLTVERWPHYKNTEAYPRERAESLARLAAERGLRLVRLSDRTNDGG